MAAYFWRTIELACTHQPNKRIVSRRLIWFICVALWPTWRICICRKKWRLNCPGSLYFNVGVKQLCLSTKFCWKITMGDRCSTIIRWEGCVMYTWWNAASRSRLHTTDTELSNDDLSCYKSNGTKTEWAMLPSTDTCIATKEIDTVDRLERRKSTLCSDSYMTLDSSGVIIEGLKHPPCKATYISTEAYIIEHSLVMQGHAISLWAGWLARWS